jgi:hypothetical protein
MPALFLSIGERPSASDVQSLGVKAHMCVPRADSWHPDVKSLVRRVAMLYTTTWAVAVVDASAWPTTGEISDCVSSLASGRRLSNPKVWAATRDDVAIDGFENASEDASEDDPEQEAPLDPEEAAEILSEIVPMFRTAFEQLGQSVADPPYRRLLEAVKGSIVSRDAHQPKCVFVGAVPEKTLELMRKRVGVSGRVVVLGSPKGADGLVRTLKISDAKLVSVYSGTR